MNLFKISDKIVFNTLKNIKFGYLEITNHFNDGIRSCQANGNSYENGFASRSFADPTSQL